MKALSFRDPWGYLVALGLKPVENRDWSTKFRGRIYIHVSKTFDSFGEDWIYFNADLPMEVRNLMPTTDWEGRPRGAIIGEVSIVDCVTEYPSPWFTGKYGLVLANAKLYDTPILHVRGRVFPHFFEPESEGGMP